MIDEAVRRARKNEEWRSEYMKELLHELQSQVSVLQNLYQPISYS